MIEFVKPKKALNVAFSKLPVNLCDIEKLKSNFDIYVQSAKKDETEEYHKNLIRDFLKNTWYFDDEYKVNTNGREDLVICSKSEKPIVIIEAKSPSNKSEMFSAQNQNCKALQECVYYFLQEVIEQKNNEIKKIIISNYDDFFIFDAKDFFRFFVAKSNPIYDEFVKFQNKQLTDTKTSFFYENCAKKAIDDWISKEKISVVHFSKDDFILENQENLNYLVPLFKILSPENLLNKPFANDSNSLDKNFYAELLHIIGLEEVSESGKKLIKRKEKSKRNKSSLLELAISELEEDISNEEICFETALRLVITWVNRLIFLKLVESQQLSYQNQNSDYAFLTSEKIQDFDELNDLFFKVLGKKIENRDEDLQKKFCYVPYLNSSLFEPSEDESLLKIRGIKNRPLEIYSQTVLKDSSGKKLSGELDNLQYIFKFLESYNFSSESSGSIQEKSKTLINASVLGLIFEKINGYKDGSFFTPGYITQYMAQESIDKAVISKFNEIKNWNCQTLDDLEEKITEIDRSEANLILNSVHVCDPAVGSGHFLVSALNRLLFIKSYLNILQDKNGRRIKKSDWEIKLENDEISVVDEDGEQFVYKFSNSERQRIQETLFAEKRTIIENCLFGVDLNPASVYICRLRLWIELLKNTYYTSESNFSNLETLPNIDINIKTGNSLISKFPVEIGKSISKNNEQSKNLKSFISQYKNAVLQYKNENNKEKKKKVKDLIRKIKGELHDIVQFDLFDEDYNKKILENDIFKNSLEWMIEFPEVLDDDGIFLGFDCVIGNPPYISAPAQVENLKLKNQREYLTNCKIYKSLYQKWDLYIPFVELGLTKICKPNGIFSMIIPYPFTNQLYAREMKKIILEKYNLFNVVDLKDFDIFDNATVKNCIPFVQNSAPTQKTWISTMNDKEEIKKIFEQDFSKLVQDEKSGVWNLTQENRELDRYSNMNVLGDFCYISVGMVLNADEKTAKGEFVKDDLISLTKDEIYCKKYIEGKDIEKYKTNRIRYLEYNTDRVPSKIRRPTFPELYTSKKLLANTLGDFRVQIDNIGEIYCNHKIQMILLWNSLKNVENKSITSSIKKFSKLTRQEMEKLSETIDLKYLLGIMNSKYASVLLKNIRGDDINIYPEHIRNIPIPTATKEQQNEIISLVDKVLEAKKVVVSTLRLGSVTAGSTTVDTTEWEKQIDALVYKLYGLTEEETKVTN